MVDKLNQCIYELNLICVPFENKTLLQIGKPLQGSLRSVFFCRLSGNAAWLCTFVARERGEEGEWDEWGR